MDKDKRIAELEARVAELEEAAGRLFRIKNEDSSYTVLTVDINHLHDLLNRQPAQSLDRLRAQVLGQAALDLIDNFQINGDLYQEYQRVVDWLLEEANRLEQGEG